MPLSIITLRRTFRYALSTKGEMEIDGKRIYTLEPTWRDLEQGEQKVAGKTAVPAGTYRITLYYSPRHRRTVPLLHDVPGFSYVEIHPGNYPEDSEGCILPGLGTVECGGCHWVMSSLKALSIIMQHLRHELRKGNSLALEIIDDF